MFAGSTMTRAALLHVGDGGLAPADRPPGCSRTACRARPQSARPAGPSDRARPCSRARHGSRFPPWPDRLRPAPSSTLRMAAASATVRVIGPAVSWLCAIGTMPVRLTSPSVGLNPDERGAVRGADDGAVGFGADRGGGEVRRDRGARSGARAARVAIECVGILRLPAAPAPAAGRMRRSKVRPLAQVRLAENHRAGVAQPRRPETRRAARGHPRAPATRRSSSCDRPWRCCP